jgi:hypothetical protein
MNELPSSSMKRLPTGYRRLPPTYSPPPLSWPSYSGASEITRRFPWLPQWGTGCPPAEPFDILSAEIASATFSPWPSSVVGTNGYWYPLLTVLPEVRLNSNFVFGTGWWAENGA